MKTATLMAAVVLVTPLAAAQVPPDRIGNVWNGKSHQPSAAEVQQNERAAGIALPQAREQRENAEVEQQAHKLIDKSRRESGGRP